MNFSILCLYPAGQKSICIALPLEKRNWSWSRAVGLSDSEKMEILNQIAITSHQKRDLCTWGYRGGSQEGIFLSVECKAQDAGNVWAMLIEECFSFGRSPHWEVSSDSSPSRIKKKRCHWDRSLCTLRSRRLLREPGGDGRRRSGEPGRSVWQPVLQSWNNLIRNANWLRRVGRPRNTLRMKTCDPQAQRKMLCKRMVMLSVEVKKPCLPHLVKTAFLLLCQSFTWSVGEFLRGSVQRVLQVHLRDQLLHVLCRVFCIGDEGSLKKRKKNNLLK